MKINTLNGEIMDTDKMNDLKALVTEKSYDFYKFCVENKVPCAVITKYVSHHHIVIEGDDELTPEGKLHISALGFRRLLGLVDGFVKMLTSNYLAVLPNQLLPPIDNSEKWKQE